MLLTLFSWKFDVLPCPVITVQYVLHSIQSKTSGMKRLQHLNYINQHALIIGLNKIVINRPANG